MAVVACFLAWRMRDPERASVAAIHHAGGRVHYNYESPNTSTSWFSVAMLPGYQYFSQVRVLHHGASTPTASTVSQIILGTNIDSRVGVVELQLEQITPSIIAHLKSLSRLHTLILDMPAGMLPEDSDEVQTLKSLQKQFDGIVCPAYNRGFDFAEQRP
jgi:hypothetical protein